MTDAVPEAKLKATDIGLVPEGDGWFVLNARDVSWITEPGARTGHRLRRTAGVVAGFGFRIQVLSPRPARHLPRRVGGRRTSSSSPASACS